MDKIFGFSFSTRSFQETVDAIIELGAKRVSAYVCVSNVHMLITAIKSEKFSFVLNHADYAILDGMPLCWSYNLFYGYKPDRIAGRHLMHSLLVESVKKNISVYIYGSEDHKLEKANIYILNNYSGIQIAGMYSPPFRSLTEAEETQVINKINASGAGLVFVALGCPKQEIWMNRMKGRINATMLGIGIALETLTHQQLPTPKWIENSGFEWLFRLIKEPNKLFKRYLITNSLFLKYLFTEFLAHKISKVENY